MLRATDQEEEEFFSVKEGEMSVKPISHPLKLLVHVAEASTTIVMLLYQ